MIDVVWQDTYYPIGHFINRDSGDAAPITEYQRANSCFIGNRKILVVMIGCTSSAGHGDPAITAKRPIYVYADTAETAPISAIVTVVGCQ